MRVNFWWEVILLVWVDDILIVGGGDEVKATRKNLQEAFKIRIWVRLHIS